MDLSSRNNDACVIIQGLVATLFTGSKQLRVCSPIIFCFKGGGNEVPKAVSISNFRGILSKLLWKIVLHVRKIHVF